MLNMTVLMQPLSEPVLVRPLRTAADYHAALAEIDQLFAAEPGTPDDVRLEILLTLVEAYEDVHYPMGMPDPIAMIEHVMETQNLTRADLEPFILVSRRARKEPGNSPTSAAASP